MNDKANKAGQGGSVFGFAAWGFVFAAWWFVTRVARWMFERMYIGIVGIEVRMRLCVALSVSSRDWVTGYALVVESLRPLLRNPLKTRVYRALPTAQQTRDADHEWRGSRR